jgi:hypothetical protein
MIRILNLKTLPECDNLGVAVLEKDKLAWLILADSTFKKYYKFWSQKADSSSTSAEEIIFELSSRLCGVHVTSEGFREKIFFCPTGWDYWGLGKPQPIADYLSYEFYDEALEFMKFNK